MGFFFFASSTRRTLPACGELVELLISETTQNDPNSLNGGVTYTWDEVGNRTGRTSTLPPAAGVTNQAFSGLYDVADRFTNHSFDDNGSTLGADGKTYTYDTRRRLTRVQGTGLDVQYLYDSDGNLLQKIDAVAGVTTKYVFDNQNATGYSQTLEEIVNGTSKVRYTYGNRLISRAEWNGSQWSRRFYQFDGEGNVAFLTDETGTVTDRYTYADGRVIRHDGTSTNEFLMKGERVDPATGLVFLRARWMDTNYERFMTRDSFEGDNADPITRNAYLFGGGDQVNKIDPNGFDSTVLGNFRGIIQKFSDLFSKDVTFSEEFKIPHRSSTQGIYLDYSVNIKGQKSFANKCRNGLLVVQFIQGGIQGRYLGEKFKWVPYAAGYGTNPDGKYCFPDWTVDTRKDRPTAEYPSLHDGNGLSRKFDDHIYFHDNAGLPIGPNFLNKQPIPSGVYLIVDLHFVIQVYDALEHPLSSSPSGFHVGDSDALAQHTWDFTGVYP